MKRVFYYYQSAHDMGIDTHAQKQMKKLGIKYYHCQGQSLFDGFEFWIDDDIVLPPYIKELEYEPPPGAFYCSNDKRTINDITK